MKMFPKMQDHTIDRLLRAQSGGSGKELPLCREFDADLANAYVERSLTTHETARYEQHLAACSPCRKSIITLTRMAQADVAAARPAPPVGATTRRSVGQTLARRPTRAEMANGRRRRDCVCHHTAAGSVASRAGKRSG